MTALENQNLTILGIGIGENKTDGVTRFEYFCKSYGLNYKILGEGKKWYGGDMSVGPGGGQKINEVMEGLSGVNENDYVVICDTFDLFPIASPEEIINKFHQLCPDNNYVLFSSEVYCWPDEKLVSEYPESKTKYKFLNSGSMMGLCHVIKKLIGDDKINNTDDDQLYFTKKFLSGEKIILDYDCHLFQALNGAKTDVVIHKIEYSTK